MGRRACRGTAGIMSEIGVRDEGTLTFRDQEVKENDGVLTAAAEAS